MPNDIEDYTCEQMLEMFKRQAELQDLVLDLQAERALLSYFETVESDDGFGNGRGFATFLRRSFCDTQTAWRQSNVHRTAI